MEEVPRRLTFGGEAAESAAVHLSADPSQAHLRGVCGAGRMMALNGEQPGAFTQFVADRGG
jgi:hypothetical protein